MWAAQQSHLPKIGFGLQSSIYLFAIVSELVSESALAAMIHIYNIHIYSFQCQISKNTRPVWAHESVPFVWPPKKSSKPPKILTVPKKRPTADGNSETGFVKRIGLLNRKSVDLWWPEIGNSGCFSSFVGPPQKNVKVLYLYNLYNYCNNSSLLFWQNFTL